MYKNNTHFALVFKKITFIGHRVPKGVPSLNISNMKKESSFDYRIYAGFTWYALFVPP